MPAPLDSVSKAEQQQSMIYKDTKTRTLTKTVIWRVIATSLTWGTIFGFTGRLSESVEIALIAAILSMTAYYFHERVWNAIRWGKYEAKK